MASPPLYGSMQQPPTGPGTMQGRRRFRGSQAQQGGAGGAPPMLQQPQATDQPSGLQVIGQGTMSTGGQSPQQQQAPQQQAQQPRMTFAQMQQNGYARPAPPPNYGGATPQSALSQSVTQALQNPSAYGAPQVQQTYDMLNQRLGQDYDYQRKQLNDELGSRGISESTIAGQRYSDLATEQARDQANMATQLATQAAQTYGQDRTAAQNAGLGYGNLGVNQGQLGLAQLANQQQYGLQQGGLTGQYGGIPTLAAQQLGLQQQLGLGQLGLQQGELTGNYGGQSTLGAQQLSQQGSQFQQQQALAQQLGLGGLGIQQGQLDLSKMLGLGNLGLQQQQLGQQASQFGQTFGLQSLQNQQQYGLQQQAQQLAQALGLGGLGIQQGQLDLSKLQNSQQYGLQSQAQQNQSQQFQQQLAQALQLATMGDVTANRGIDAQAALAQNDLMLKVASLLAGYGGYGGAGGGGPTTSGYTPFTGGASGSGGGGGGDNTGTTGYTPFTDQNYMPQGGSFFGGGQLPSGANPYAYSPTTTYMPYGGYNATSQSPNSAYTTDYGQTAQDGSQLPTVAQAGRISSLIANDGMSQEDAWAAVMGDQPYNPNDFSQSTSGGNPVPGVASQTPFQTGRSPAAPQGGYVDASGQYHTLGGGSPVYLQNGLTTNGAGQAVTKGPYAYNALQSASQQNVAQGLSPGAFGPGMLQLLAQNPMMAYAMFPNVPRSQLDQWIRGMTGRQTPSSNPYGSIPPNPYG